MSEFERPTPFAIGQLRAGAGGGDEQRFPDRAADVYDLTSSGLEGLLVRVGALEAAILALETKKPDAVESVRRLVRSIGGLTRKYDVPEIRESILAVERASAGELPDALAALVELLKRLAASASNRKLELLVIDDDPDYATLLRIRLAAANREVLVAGTAAEADGILAQHSPALILLDLRLPDSDGRNLLMRFREERAMTSVPIFVITASSDFAHRAECLGLGADEFFEKPLNLDTVALAVSTHLRRSAEMSKESQRDPLTGLPNRESLRIEFDRVQKSFSRTGGPVAIAMLDIDHFKEVNDRHGHLAGDEVLRRLAKLLRRSLRGSDFVCRWGGEELVLVLPDTDDTIGAKLLEKMLAGFRAERFVVNGAAFNVTFSAGVANIAPGASLDEAVAEADLRLYLAKSGGRNRIMPAGDSVA